MPTKRVALFFGSFNPVHVGHMVIATWVAEFGKVDGLWFVPSPQNPLKERSGLLPYHHRLEMLRLAVGDDSRFRVSDIESRLSVPSYTADTLAHLHEKYPEVQFSLVMGGDNLATFHKWKNHRYIIDNHPILVYTRPGQGATAFDAHPQVRFIDAPVMAISSTAIREMVADGRNVRHLMPYAAWAYLDQMNLFRRT
jgi:nicotinate-nucleotide adenylyltransferase